MIDANVERLIIDKDTKLLAHPDLDVLCTVWDNWLHETLDTLEKHEISLDMSGTNMSRERWCINLLPLTSKAKEILRESPIMFSTSSWI